MASQLNRIGKKARLSQASQPALNKVTLRGLCCPCQQWELRGRLILTGRGGKRVIRQKAPDPFFASSATFGSQERLRSLRRGLPAAMGGYQRRSISSLRLNGRLWMR